MTENDEAIRQIFTDRRPYSVAEVANLTGITCEILFREIESRDLSLEAVDSKFLPWSEVAYLALRRWPISHIYEALGSEASSFIPDLLRPTEVSMTLPTYQLRALEVLARDQQLDLSTFVQLHLLDLVSAESPFLAEQIPGFLAAFHFPFGEER